MDSKEVIMIINCHRSETEVICSKKDVMCPTAIAKYNKIMDGVDIADQKVQVYDFDQKSTEWWKQFFL